MVGAAAVALATGGAAAPAGGQKVFDAPGCRQVSYDGPGRRPHHLLGRNCPRPQAVIVASVSGRGKGARVTLDGSRSFDPMNGSLVAYSWEIGPGRTRAGRRIVVSGLDPGPHKVVLEVTDDSGIPGGAAEVVNVP